MGLWIKANGKGADSCHSNPTRSLNGSFKDGSDPNLTRRAQVLSILEHHRPRRRSNKWTPPLTYVSSLSHLLLFPRSTRYFAPLLSSPHLLFLSVPKRGERRRETTSRPSHFFLFGVSVRLSPFISYTKRSPWRSPHLPLCPAGVPSPPLPLPRIGGLLIR